jgi:adenine deaminase
MIAPGKRADIVVVGDLAACSVQTVISAGRVVDDALFATRRKVAPVGLESVKTRAMTAADFGVPGESENSV